MKVTKKAVTLASLHLSFSPKNNTRTLIHSSPPENGFTSYIFCTAMVHLVLSLIIHSSQRRLRISVSRRRPKLHNVWLRLHSTNFCVCTYYW